jgi:hypothetical protein
MVEIEIDCGYLWLADQLEKHVGPRKFVLHNRIGGDGWDVRPGDPSNKGRSVARFDDPKMATFIQLKL